MNKLPENKEKSSFEKIFKLIDKIEEETKFLSHETNRQINIIQKNRKTIKEHINKIRLTIKKQPNSIDNN